MQIRPHSETIRSTRPRPFPDKVGLELFAGCSKQYVAASPFQPHTVDILFVEVPYIIPQWHEHDASSATSTSFLIAQ
jgi:hypothetical protein